MKRYVLGLVLAILAAVAGVALWRTHQFTASAPQLAALPKAPDLGVDRAAAAERLAYMLRFKTISVQDGQPWDEAPFTAQLAWLETSYPAIFAAAQKEVVSGASLVLTWPGSEPGLKPILLLAHLDVVPVEESTRANWGADPFGGEVRDGYIWGRGALDDKNSVIAILEAANALASKGFAPKRTVIFAFGHDEEVSGLRGAGEIARRLSARGVKAWFALDEGQVVISRHPMTDSPVALIGVSEKGYATLEVTAKARAGHSSIPDPDTAVSLLSEAVLRVHRMRIEMGLSGGPAREMVQSLAPQLDFATRFAAANEWLLGPVINAQLGRDPVAAALLRTTVAPTMAEAGTKENVLPGEARAVINFRLHPRDSAAEILAAAKDAVATVPGVTVAWLSPPTDPSPVSSVQSSSYALLGAVARSAGDGAAVAPSLVLGATDGRHYAAVAEDVYRFTPVVLGMDDVSTIHGYNERISVDNLERMIKAYGLLLVAGAGPSTK